MEGLQGYSKNILRKSGSASKESDANSGSAICNLPLDVYLEILLNLDFGELNALRKVRFRIFTGLQCIPHFLSFVPDSVVGRYSIFSKYHASGLS